MSHPEPNRFDLEIAQQGSKISSALHMLRSQQYPPDARKGLRKFQLGEVEHEHRQTTGPDGADIMIVELRRP